MSTVLICERCGAPLPAVAVNVSVTCGYCGSTTVPAPRVVERVVEGTTEHLVALLRSESRAQAGPPCPRCGEAFHSTSSGEHTVLYCRTCGGAFLDTASVALLMLGADEGILQATSRALLMLMPYRGDRRGELTCPHCQHELTRSDLGETGHSINTCAAHGTFFDRGEVPEFAGYHRDLRVGEISEDDLANAGLPGRGWFGKG